MKARGQAAFSLSTDEVGRTVQMRAELLHGAQLNRSDRLVFSRAGSIETTAGTFNGSLKAILDDRLTGKYLKSLEWTTAQSSLPGVSISLEVGKLEIRFSSAAADRKTWTKARSGNLYTVVNFWLGLDQQRPSFGAGIPPPGPAAFFDASLIFERSAHPR